MDEAVQSAKRAWLGADLGQRSSHSELASLTQAEWQAAIDHLLDRQVAPESARVHSESGVSVGTGAGGVLMSGEGAADYEDKWAQPGLARLREDLYQLREPLVAMLQESPKHFPERSMQDVIAGVQAAGALGKLGDAVGILTKDYDANSSATLAKSAEAFLTSVSVLAPETLSADTQAKWDAIMPALQTESSDRNIAQMLADVGQTLQTMGPQATTSANVKELLNNYIQGLPDSASVLPQQSPGMRAVLMELSQTIARPDASPREITESLARATLQAEGVHEATRDRAVDGVNALVPATQADLDGAVATYHRDVAKLNEALERAGIPENARPAAVVFLANEGLYREMRDARSATSSPASLSDMAEQFRGAPGGGESRMDQLRSYLMRCEPNAVLDEKSGTTALMAASRLGMQDVAQSLLARGADPAARNADGATAADLAREARQAPTMAQDRGMER